MFPRAGTIIGLGKVYENDDIEVTFLDAQGNNASKDGQVSFTQSLASVYTKQNIVSNTVAPGAVETDMFPDEWVEGVKKGYPLKRLVQPEEVAEAVVFLSNTTSISGEVIEIDQGKLL